MKRLTAVLFVLFAVLPARPSMAETTVAVSLSPWALVYTGAVIVNSGVALGNGIGLASGNPQRLNGQFGLVTGTATAIVAGVMYAADHEFEYAEEAALILGGSGLVSAVLGRLTVKAADEKDKAPRLSPTVLPCERGVSVGVMLQF